MLVKNLLIPGVISAMATPLTPEQKLDIKATKQLVKHLLDGGVHGIFTVSGAGEFSSLDLEEKEELIRITVAEVNGKVPIIAGAGAVTTREAIKVTRISEKLGADGVCVIAPYSTNPSQNELYNHFRDVAESTSLSVILYNHPQKTGLTLAPDLVKKLAEIDNIVGVKDSSNNLSLTMEYLGFQNEKFAVYAGIDNLILASLMYGATGTISSSAGVLPGLVVKIYASFLKGDYETALKAQNDLFQFRRLYTLGSFPTVIKAALNMMGIPVGLPKKPIAPLTEENREKLRLILKELGAL
jgi:4-hydroxy-tetrahydrodipicolinate synthase